jgi:hypothetical protein
MWQVVHAGVFGSEDVVLAEQRQDIPWKWASFGAPSAIQRRTVA